MAVTKRDKQEDAAEPQGATFSLIRKVSSLGVPATIVFGGTATGKSTLVRDTLRAAGRNPLWLAFNNTGALDAGVGDWSVAVPSTWVEFNKGVVIPARKHQLPEYDAVVVDGLNVLVGLCLSNQTNDRPELGDWLQASKDVWQALIQLRDGFGELYAIIDVVADKSGGRKIDLNPYSKNILLPLFGNKWYTHIIKERDENNRRTGQLLYTVQRDQTLALDFIPGEPLTNGS